MFRGFRKYTTTAGLFLLGLGVAAQSALAVPSYSRQTGLPCEVCHTVPPQLTPFGRYFKINGYVLSEKSFNPSAPPRTPQESLSEFPPISAMLLVSDTYIKDSGTTQNNTVAFPDQFSLFYAGRIAHHIGAFMQITYDWASDHFSMDNTDIRWAHRLTLDNVPVTWGLTLNNNPTVQDPYNSTPAWGYPYLTAPVGDTPVAEPLLFGLGGTVAGLGAYAWWNNSIYTEVSFYRSAQVGNPNEPLDSTAQGTVSGLAPYIRVAWQHDWDGDNIEHSLEFGVLGMETHMFPTGVGYGPTGGSVDKYTDVGLDSQYQMIFPGRSSMTIHALYMHEKQTLDASFAQAGSSSVDGHLNFWQLSGQYYWHEHFGPSLAYFDINGSENPALYGTTDGSPNSRGFILQWTYLPAENVQLSAQYTYYTELNGDSGSTAHDANTLYAYAWFLW